MYTYFQSVTEDSEGQNREGVDNSTCLALSTMVPKINENDPKKNCLSQKIKNSSNSSIRQESNTSTLSKTKVDGMHIIRKKLRERGISKQSQNIIMNSWRPATRKQYNIYLQRFLRFCERKGRDPQKKSVSLAIEFLTELYHNGYGYSAVNTARSALSAIHNGIGSDPMICRFMKGVFNLRPSRPRYTTVWDMSIVLDYLRSCSPARELSLLMLGAKLLMLCAIVTGHRCQTLHALTIDKDILTISMNQAIFRVDSLLKHNSPSNPQTIIRLHSYNEDRRICVLTYLKAYLKRVKSLRADNKLFINTQYPHYGVCKETLSRWIRLILNKAGVDTHTFKAHSTRAASCSLAAKGVDVWHVLKTAGWKRESTFARFYNKPIESSSECFAKSVLSSKAVPL